MDLTDGAVSDYNRIYFIWQAILHNILFYN